MALPRKLMRPTLPARRPCVKWATARGGCWDTLPAMATPAQRTRAAIVRLLARDERVFAFLLAVGMVGGDRPAGPPPGEGDRGGGAPPPGAGLAVFGFLVGGGMGGGPRPAGRGTADG